MVCDWSFHAVHTTSDSQKDFVGLLSSRISILYIHFVWTDPLPEKSCEQKKIQFDNACVVKEAVYSTLILFCSWSQFLFLLYAVLAKTQCTHNFKKGANFGRFDCVIFSGEENKITFRKHTFCCKFFITIKLPIYMSRSHIENEFWGIYTIFFYIYFPLCKVVTFYWVNSALKIHYPQMNLDSKYVV